MAVLHKPIRMRANRQHRAAVTLEPEGQGFRISQSALTLRAQLPKMDQATFARLAGEAEKNCSASKVLKADITHNAKLI